MNTDVDAVVYMMLMNNMIHDLFPNAVVIGGCGGPVGVFWGVRGDCVCVPAVCCVGGRETSAVSVFSSGSRQA